MKIPFRLAAIITCIALTLALLPGFVSAQPDHDHKDVKSWTKADWKAHYSNITDGLLSMAEPGDEWVESGCYMFKVDNLRKSGFDPSALPWTSGIVYYTFDPNGMSDYKRDQFRRATREWEAVAALVFFEVTYGDPGVSNYILVRDHPSVNNSAIGMVGGQQIINIVSWSSVIIIAHELGHALGQWHEQQRSDRDTFVDIREEWILDGKEYNFTIVQTQNEGTTYDFGSALHYPDWAFSKDTVNEPTILAKAGYEQFQSVMGQRTELSDIDAEGMASRYGELVPAESPSLNPPGGTFSSSSVELTYNLASDHVTGLSLYIFTTDGSEPELGLGTSIIWQPGTSYILRNSCTFKIRQIRKKKLPSPVQSYVFDLAGSTPLAETPTISPPGDTYNGPLEITITPGGDGADVYYTTDGSDPTTSSEFYDDTFFINEDTVVKAKAFKSGYTPSNIAGQSYEIIPTILPAPDIYPNSGTYNGSVFVYLGSTVLGAEIRFTTNGSEPTTSSEIYGDPIQLFQSATIKAKAFRDPFGPSPTVEATYVVNTELDPPTIAPNGGEFVGSPNITLTPADPSHDVRYTTNGAEPTSYSSLYGSAFTLPYGTSTVKAKSFADGVDSSTATAVFTVYNPATNQVQAPIFSPIAGQQFNSVTISLRCDTEDALIYYTIGDNEAPPDPTTSSTLYNGEFTLGIPPGFGDRWFIRAKAFKSGLAASSVIQKNYEVITPLGTVSTPTIDPAGGTFNNSITVDFLATTNPPTTGIQYYSTTNGDDPVVPDPPGLGPSSINLSKSATVKVLAFRSFFGPSGIASEEFFFVCADPESDPEPGSFVEEVEVSLSSETTGGGTRIRYTTDGTEPEDDDEVATRYNGSFTLAEGTHIVKAKVYRNGFDPSETVAFSFVVEPTPVAPSITTHPQTQTVDQGEDVTLTVEATGVPDPEYLWYKDDDPLGTETSNTLFIPNAQPDDAGDYKVKVSNEAGDLFSNTATLTVNATGTPTPTPTATTPTPTATPTATPTGTPVDGRGSGDFNGDNCTNLDDFLILLDNWQAVYGPVGPPALGLDDFLNLLDNWQTGAGC